jgi:hypothetical protein
MMDRFNFYDIYGDVLPGTLLLGIFWLPFGLTTMSLPSSELSSTLLLLVLAYIAGHLMQMVALMVAPIMVLDTKDKKRTRSSVILDQDNTVFSNDFKKRLGKLIENAFDLKIMGAEEEAILDRETAFYQARSYLLLVKNAGYVEQYEGLYALMRGFAFAFFVGCAYLVGWGFSFHWSVNWVGEAAWLTLAASIAGALVATWFTFQYESRRRPNEKVERDLLEEKKKSSYKWVGICMLFFMAGLGYFLGTWKPAPARIEFFLWAAIPLGLISGFRCLHAYLEWAEKFAEAVWRDFSASYKPDPPTPPADPHGGAHTHEAGGAGSHVHADAPKAAPAPEHGGSHGGHSHGHVRRQGRLRALCSALPDPALLNKTVGHPGDVVGHRSRQALGGDLHLVVRW